MKRNRLFFAGKGTIRSIVLSTLIPVILIMAACGYYVLNKTEPAAHVVEAGRTTAQPVQRTYEPDKEKTNVKMNEKAKEKKDDKTDSEAIAPNNRADKPAQATEAKEPNRRPAQPQPRPRIRCRVPAKASPPSAIPSCWTPRLSWKRCSPASSWTARSAGKCVRQGMRSTG
ncbi:hypothetical protein [Paenibacillus cineris]|uniref:hypothetical protein n=1 Tax=Paenibacillus cineris TaxID=237530 RepID=UPI001BB44A9B|nr:hypothetical protein [Paenibacillus cineris]